MAEPSTTSFLITGVAAAALGPVFGPYAMIAFSAAVGSLLALSRRPTQSRLEGAQFILVGMLISLVLTAPAVWLVEQYTKIPGSVALMPMSFLLAAGRGHLLTLMDKGAEVLGGLLDRVMNRKAGEGKDGAP